MTASVPSAAPTPIRVERQPRVVPIASTMVSASTNSTPEASVVAATTPSASPVTKQRVGRTSPPGCKARGRRATARNSTPGLDNPRVVVFRLRTAVPKTFSMSDQRVTIRQLARLSGVSIGTVSRALNGYTDVNPETRERIVRLAQELDYTPAAAARSLVTQRSHLIGVFLETGEGHPDLQHPFFHEVLVGLKHEIGAGGYDLLLFASERPGNGYGDHSYLKRTRHHSVEGVVLMGVDAEDLDVRRLTRSGLPCVGVDVALSGPATEYVMSDNPAGAALAVGHLHDLGHRRVATITG